MAVLRQSCADVSDSSYDFPRQSCANVSLTVAMALRAKAVRTYRTVAKAVSRQSCVDVSDDS